ncbi:MFS transporter [Alicyclobacillus sp. SO9]|uniref:MFS transporter n=1 Tax=Alicyclobacillus sp. SO9 TaxID=2665646 RepID=UPI0018E8CCFB|nr:MFS transporter [Alicyclobacillus sp. SO9]QQE78206.1 MFS transporter [Alicyclobacillus sp. SO9]
MGLLKNRNFAILLSGQLVSTIGNNLFSIALPWYVYTLTNSKSALALTGVAQTLPAVVGLVAGVWVDRWRKRTTMISSDVVRGALSLILFAGIVLHWPLWTILVMVLALQGAGQFFSPAAGALFPLLVKKEDIPSGSGLLQSSNATAQLLGTVSGGALMGAFGAPVLFLLDAVSFFVSVISLFFIRVKEAIVPRPSETPSSSPAQGEQPQQAANPLVNSKKRMHAFLQDWLDGLKFLVSSHFLILVVSAALVVNFALAPVDIAITAWVKGPMHGVPVDLGIINGGFFIGVILGGISVGAVTKHIAIRKLLLLGLLGIGICVGIFGLFRTVVPETTIALVTGLAIGSVNGSLNAMFIQMVPEAMRGRAFGILGALSTFAMPLGMALFGWLIVQLPLHIVFILIGAVCSLSGLTFLLPVKDAPTPANQTTASTVSE